MSGLHGTRGLLAVLGVFLLLRWPALSADPAAPLVSHYQDVAFSVFDEGWWTANARELVLFGELRGTGFDLFWVSPVFTWLAALVFAIAGPSLESARSLSILLGAAGALFLWRCGRDQASARTSALAALLWSASFAGAQLGRLALPETTGTAIGLGGALALLRGGTLGNLGAGFLAVAAMLTKPHFGFLVPTFLVSGVVLAVRRDSGVLRTLAEIAGGAAIPALVWGGYLARHATEATELMSFYLTDRWFAGTPPGLSGGLGMIKPLAQVVISGVIYRHALFASLPGLFLLALIAAPRLWGAALRPRSDRASDAALLFGVWILVGGASISSLPFQPFRYYLPLLPALAFLASWALTSPATAPEHGGGRVLRGVRWGLGFFAIAQISFSALHALWPARLMEKTAARVALLNPTDFHITPFLVSVLKARSLEPFAALPREIAYVAALALCGGVALGIAALASVGLARFLSRDLLATPGFRRLAPALVVAMLLWQGVQWVRWIPGRDDSLARMGRELDELVPAGAVVSPAGTYSLESGLRYDSHAVRAGKMFDAEGGADYFVVLGEHPTIGLLAEGEIERRHPGSRRVRTFDLTGGYRYHLYRSAERSDSPAGSE